MPESGPQRFDALVEPHLAILFRVAHALVRNTADAQDLVQDTCMAACENRADLAATTYPVRWLLRVLQNRFIDGARRRKRAPFVPMDLSDDSLNVASDLPNPEELLRQADDERVLEQAFLCLNPTQRWLLSLRAEGHRLDEIEAITGIGREVLRARLHRARRALALRLSEHTSAASPARIGRQA